MRRLLIPCTLSMLAGCSGPGPVRPRLDRSDGVAATTLIQQAPAGMIEAIAFAPDGSRLAVFANDGYLRIYDAATRGLLSSSRYGSYLGGGFFSLASAVWQADDRLIVSGRLGGAVLDVAGRTIEPFPAGVLQLRRATDGVILGLEGGSIRVFGARSFRARTDDLALTRLATTPDGSLASWIGGAANDTLRVGEVETLPLHRTLSLGFLPGSLALTRDGATAFVGSHADGGTPSALFEVSLTAMARPIRRIDGEGSLRAVGISSDGRYVAGASDALVVWDRVHQRGRRHSWRDLEVRRSVDAGGFNHVAFSESSRWLAAATASAVHIFDLKSGRYMGALGDDVRSSYYVEFRDDTRLLSATRLGLTEWNLRDGRVVRRRPLPAPVAARLDEKTLQLASPTDACGPWRFGFKLWIAPEAGDGEEPEAEMESEIPCFPTGLFDQQEMWALDRSHAIAYTRIANDRNDTEVVVQNLRDSTQQRVLVDSTNARGLLFSPDGQSLVALLGGGTTEHVGLWSLARNLKTTIAVLPPSLRMPHTVRACAVSADSSRVAFIRGPRLWIWNVATGRPELEAFMPLGPAAELAVVAFAPDNETWIVAGDGSELALGRGANVLAHRLPLQLGPASIAIRGDRIALATRDGEIRILDYRTLAELASLVEFEDDEYIAVTPAGVFSGTTEAAQRVALVYTEPAELFRVDRLATSLHDPELLGRVLRGEAAPTPEVPMRPPRLQLLQPATVHGTRARIEIATARARRVRIFGEGVRVLDEPCTGVCTLTFETRPGIHRYDVVAFDDAQRSSNPMQLELPQTQPAKGALWILAAGVSEYPNLDGFDRLSSADADACAIADAFGSVGQAKVRETATLINGAVTTQSVLAVLRRFEDMKPDDLAVLYFSGHAVRGPTGESMFLTRAAIAKHGVVTDESAGEHSIRWSALAEPLRRLRGRVLIMLDTCHSGGFGQEQIVASSELADDLDRGGRAGLVVFASSKGRQRSAEIRSARSSTSAATCRALPRDPRTGGLFRRAIVDVLANDARHDVDGDGLRVSELVNAVSFSVHRLTSGAQTPWVARRETFADFLLVPAVGLP